jgi:hypothetical protein
LVVEAALAAEAPVLRTLQLALTTFQMAAVGDARHFPQCLRSYEERNSKAVMQPSQVLVGFAYHIYDHFEQHLHSPTREQEAEKAPLG